MRKREIERFQNILYTYYKTSGREFPWRKTRNPYCIWISEIMLQQTQVDRVVPKYAGFLKQFPSVRILTTASLREVLTAWQGLGYNRRARLLHEASKVLVSQYRGKIPRGERELLALPGIGAYTAGAIRAFAFNLPGVLIETNIRTVYIHHFFKNRREVSDAMLRPYIEATIDYTCPRVWYTALMDYGTHLKQVEGNLNAKSKHYIKQSRFDGSDRQIRGAIIRLLSTQDSLISPPIFFNTLPYEKNRIKEQLNALTKEGMISCTKRKYELG